MSWQGHNAHSEWPAAAWCLATASPQLPPPAFLARVTWPAVLLGATQTSEQPTYVLCMAASPPHSRTPGRLGHTTALTAITQSLRDAGGRLQGTCGFSLCLHCVFSVSLFQTFSTHLLRHSPTDQAAALVMHTVVWPPQARSHHLLASDRGEEGHLLCKLWMGTPLSLEGRDLNSNTCLNFCTQHD